MSWNLGDKRKLFLKIKAKLVIYYAVLTNTRNSYDKTTLSVVQMKQYPDIEKIDSRKEFVVKNG